MTSSGSSRATLFRRGFRPRALALFLGATILPFASASAQAVPVAKAPVEYHLQLKDAVRGGEVVVRLGVQTKVELSAVSIAVNFDEEDLRLVAAENLLPTAAVDSQPAPIVSADNRDDLAGNQASEGWIHIELGEKVHLRAVNSHLGEIVPVYALRFKVRDQAKDGVSKLRFEDIGPVRSDVGEVYFKNAVRLTGEDAQPLATEPVADENLFGGGINIIGEVGFFVRGDATYDFHRDISDPIFSLELLFVSIDRPFPCQDSADSNDDGHLSIADPIHTLIKLFLDPSPFPDPDAYGPDPTDDRLDCDAGGLSH